MALLPYQLTHCRCKCLEWTKHCEMIHFWCPGFQESLVQWTSPLPHQDFWQTCHFQGQSSSHHFCWSQLLQKDVPKTGRIAIGFYHKMPQNWEFFTIFFYYIYYLNILSIHYVWKHLLLCTYHLIHKNSELLIEMVIYITS